jgi:hypothetical protein
MNRASPSFIRGFFVGVFFLGAVVSMGALVMPIGDPAMRTLAAVNLPVNVVLILGIYRREVRALKAGAA